MRYLNEKSNKENMKRKKNNIMQMQNHMNW